MDIMIQDKNIIIYKVRKEVKTKWEKARILIIKTWETQNPNLNLNM